MRKMMSEARPGIAAHGAQDGIDGLLRVGTSLKLPFTEFRSAVECTSFETTGDCVFPLPRKRGGPCRRHPRIQLRCQRGVIGGDFLKHAEAESGHGINAQHVRWVRASR